MKIAVLNGSPKVGNTAAMINAFKEGAEAAGHEVLVSTAMERARANVSRKMIWSRSCPHIRTQI